jgi:NAD-dependent dihydropyrimidine dehydrogenase PreA subunit
MAETVQENTGPRLSRRNFFRNLARTGLHEGMKHAGLSEENYDDFTPPGRLFVATSSDTLRPFVPEIAAERCNGCDACIRLCPHQALVFVGAGDGECYEIHPENCSGCKVCVDVCEQDAITLNVWKSSQQDKVSLQYGRCTACGASFHIPEVQSMVENRQRCRICSQHNHYQNLYQVLEQ